MSKHTHPMMIRDINDISGDLYYSSMQWYQMREKGPRDRTFAQLFTGEIVEYTELIPISTLKEEPYDLCPYPDAVYLGKGSFHHFTDEDGYEY